MGWYFLLGTFAAFGFLSLLWIFFGWLLTGKGGWYICAGPKAEAAARCCLWLRELGLLRGRVILISDSGQELPENLEIWSLEELTARLELERKKLG